MALRITGLPREAFADLFDLSEEALKARGALRRVCGATPGLPCRISLEDAEPGETVILLHYEHQSADTPFRASHAIFVRPAAARTYDAVDAVPRQLRLRTLSLRAFDAEGMLVDADLVEGAALEGLAERMLANRNVDYLHAHFARQGCYAARIERA